MIAPKKPIEPVAPIQRQTSLSLNYEINGNNIKMSAVPKMLFKAQEALKERNPNAAIEGEWKLSEIQVKYYSSTLVWTGGEVSWDNPSYTSALRYYEAELKKYPVLLRDYEEKLAKYNYWKQNKTEIAREKKRKMLEKQLNLIQEKLKEL